MKNAIFILLSISFFGCSVARRDQRALNRVEANVNLLNTVFSLGLALHPCANDTVIKHHSDTTVINDTTETFYTQTDTLNKTDTVKIKIKVTTLKTIHDTVNNYMVDNRLLKNTSDSLIHYKQLNDIATGKIFQITHERNVYKWVLIAISMLVCIGATLKIYKAFQPASQASTLLSKIGI